MSDILERMRKKAAERRLKGCTVLGEKVRCRIHSQASFSALAERMDSGDDKSVAKLICDQFVQLESEEPVLTVDFIINEMSQPDAAELVNLFLSMNGSGAAAVENAEKN
jgi:hypothetical protein